MAFKKNKIRIFEKKSHFPHLPGELAPPNVLKIGQFRWKGGQLSEYRGQCAVVALAPLLAPRCENLVSRRSAKSFIACCQNIFIMSGRRKRYRTLAEKRQIVQEAYAQPGLIKQTARKYDVYPSNIRRWRKSFGANEASNISSQNRTMNWGRAPNFQEVDEQLRHFVAERRAHSLGINTSLVIIVQSYFSHTTNKRFEAAGESIAIVERISKFVSRCSAIMDL